MNNLSRNRPLAFVVGAAGFLGSHLVEQLLKKGIGVVGVDDYSLGTKENLGEASKDKNFLLLSQKATDSIPFKLPRLDYAFFLLNPQISAADYQGSFKNFWDICSAFKPKIVLSSSIDLYDNEGTKWPNLQQAEKMMAEYALKNKINARIVRLAALYGPRMNFLTYDPMMKLIRSALLGKLNKEPIPLDFSNRSIFITDAVSLLIKAVMHGATAQKIYDGALFHPIKIAEIKQVLLDPLWHEAKGFSPTELPPWPTPNLKKTEKELLWKPQTSVVTGLRQTMAYFQDNPDLVSKISQGQEEVVEEEKEQGGEKITIDPIKEWKKDWLKEREKTDKDRGDKLAIKKDWTRQIKNWLLILSGTSLITYALIYPILSLLINLSIITTSLDKADQALFTGEVTRAESEVKAAQKVVGEIKGMINTWLVLGRLGFFKEQFDLAAALGQIMESRMELSLHQTLGTKALLDGWQGVVGGLGERKENSGEAFPIAESELNLAEKKLNFLTAQLNNPKLRKLIPSMFWGQMETWVGDLASRQAGLELVKSAATFLSSTIPFEGKKNYLVVLVDNTTLRPGGGVIIATALVSLEEGRLMDIVVEDVDKLDSQLGSVNPPDELRADLGINRWGLGEANSEPDFPTNAKMMQWFYQKATGRQADGVIALDLSIFLKLLQAEGIVDVPGSGEKVSQDLILGKINPEKEKEIRSSLLKELLNRLFFLSQHNFSMLGQVLTEGLLGKHLLFYSTDPILFSYLTFKGWSGVMPRQDIVEAGLKKAFLAMSETTIGDMGVNYYLPKNIDLQTTISADSKVSHQLTLIITNTSPNLKAKSKLKVYLPAGSRLKKALFGGKDIFSTVSSFTDFGRASYSLLLQVGPKESQTLSLGYEDLRPIVFKEGQAEYILEVRKQPGSGEDQFNFRLSYPEGWRLISKETSFSTTLSSDKSFKVVLGN